MKNIISTKVLAEFIGTFFLVLTVVGSGIMGENLSDNLALTLLGNSLATGAILFVIITTVSYTHLTLPTNREV